MNVIVFASRKGGSGKSTLAAHLAAHVHKATKPCLLIDADPQGSLTLWHKLRGTNEPAIKTAVNSVSGIVSAAKRDGIEWVFIDTPPNMSAVVEDAIRNATMAIIPARPGVFDVNAVQETIQSCRTARKPYAVVLNGAPARRDEVESPIVTIARESLTKFRAPVWGGQITNRADLLMALSHGRGGNQPAMGCDRTLGEGNPWQCDWDRRDAQTGGIVSPHRQADKGRAGSARFSVVALPFPPGRMKAGELSDHQHVEDDHRR
jgi:chromosome partitioning protein